MFAQLTRRFTHPGVAFALLGALLVTAAPARAQAPTGTILGIVKDAQGAVVPGATVTATNLGTQYSRSAVTDAAGEYALRLLPVGNYEVTVNLEGFKNFTQTGIVLEVGRNARVDAALALGAVSETLTVVGDSPLVDTASSSLSRTVGQNEVLNLPLVNRDLYTLLNLTGGVSDNTNSNSLGGPEQLTTINGSGKAQMGTVNFQLDGGNNTAGLRGTGNPAPNPEAVQEFRVLTNGYAAEYGRYSAGVVDVVTKSGTNVFHGAGFDFFRNEKLNSPRWAPPGTTGTTDPLSRKQYGGAIGGPIAKDKMFFFASYSGLRQEETYYRNTAVVPTARERAGDFSLSSIKPRDPVTGVAFPGDLIPAARFDIAAKTILDRFVPMSNLPNNFFEVRAPDPIQTDEGTFKLDRQFSSTQTLAVSYFFQKGVDTQPLTGTGNIPWVDRDFRWKQHNVNASHTWTMSPTTINQFRGTYVRQFGGRVNSPAMSLGDLNSKFTIQGDPTLPRLTVTGYFTGQTAIAGPDAGSNYFGVKDAVSITKGKHALKLGGDVSYEKIIHDTLLDNYGVFTFNASKTGNAFADFLLGLPATMTQDAPVRKTDNGAYLSAFAQDDFRVLPRLTLNLGLRYDLQFPFTDPQDRKLAFVPGQQSKINPSAPLGLLFPGDEGVSRGIVHTDVNNIAPRLGFAWDPRGDGRTAVRAAFGMFYGSITGNEWNTTADNQPFTVRQSFPTVFTLSDPYRNLPGGVGPFPFVYTPGSPRFTLPAQVFGPSLDFVWPVSYQTNITVEREIGRSFSTSASFVVSNARHLAAGVDNNYPVLTTTATTTNVNTRRPYLPGTIGQATVLSSIFASDYKGLQLSAERRGSRWSGKAYYSVGRGYDDVDFQGGGLPGVQNATRLADERARTASDRTHMFSLSGVWRIEYAKNASTVVRALASDWTLSAIVILQTGQPFTIASGQDRNLDGLTNDRADLVGDPSVDHSQPRDVLIENWFNVAAFAQPALGTNGNSGRNIIDGPGYKNVDFGLFRDVRLKGRTAVQFRLEATNLFNIVNLNNPGNSLAAPATFGKIRSARAMRQIQLGARVSF